MRWPCSPQYRPPERMSDEAPRRWPGSRLCRDGAECFHRELAEPLAAAKVDRVFLVGEAMAALHRALPEGRRGGWWQSADDAIPALLRFLEPGDVVTIKGSRGVRVSRIVERLCAQAAAPET